MKHGQLLIAGALALMSACGGPDEKPATFTNVQTDVFSLSCVFSACHKGAAPAGEMSLEGDAFDDIVDVLSMQVPTKLRVKPGDPDGFYLMDKLLGKQTVGDQMPQGASLEEERLDFVRRWIMAGAPDN